MGLAVAAGYLLGRTHKMKWALGLAALAGRGRLPGIKGGLLQQGAEFITSSPEFAKLTGEMRGRLVDAGKAAAVAAVSSKIDSLSDGLHERSETMRATKAGGAGGAEAGDEEEAEAEDERYRRDDVRDRDEDRAADARRKRHADEDDDSGDQAERVPAPRGESDRPRGNRESRREEAAARGREGTPSRHGGEGDGARSGGSARQGQDSGRPRPRSSASRDGGGSG